MIKQKRMYEQPNFEDSKSLTSLRTKLLKNRVIILDGEVDTRLATSVIAQLLLLDVVDKPITVYLNTPGGNINDGMAIYDIIKYKIKSKVNMVVNGIAASMGVIILLSTEHRTCFKHSRVMIHQPLTSTGARMVKQLEFEQMSKSLTKSRNMLENIIFENTTFKSKASVIDTMDKKDFWFDSEQCLEFGFVKRIIR